MQLDPKRTAVVCIDMHRGHLDPTVATLPLPADRAARVVRNTARFLGELRACCVPVIHVVVKYRSPEETACNPFYAAMHDDPTKARRAILGHNLAGSPGTEVMPELWESSDILVDTKRRFSCFLTTDLEFVLRSRRIDTVILCGVNTNTCVLYAAFDGTSRDLRVIVAEECTDTMDGDEMRRFALRVISASLGWVMHTQEIVASLTDET